MVNGSMDEVTHPIVNAAPAEIHNEDGKHVSPPVSRTSSIRLFEQLGGVTDAGDDATFKSTVTKWYRSQKAQHRRRVETYSALDWAAMFLPCISWIRTYKVRDNLLLDVVTGLSVGFMVVPQSMSYALLAGLPAVFGLYNAFLPVLIYSIFGSSRHLAVGPVAVTSLMLGNALHSVFPEADQIEDPNDPGEFALIQADYNTAAIQITLLVAIMYFSTGFLRLGFLANFLSHSVISGFTTGAAVMIGLSQAKYFFGIKIANKETALETFIELVKHVDETQWREFVMAMTWLSLLLTIKYVSKKYPRLSWLRPFGPISVCALSIITVVVGSLDTDGLVRTVKHVPKGFPNFTVGWWFPFFNVGKQISTSIAIFLVDFMESISIAKAIARKHKYEVKVNQEITAMSFANIFGAMFNAYPATGSFSRSAVSGDIGAKTQLQGTITGTLVMFVLLFITPVFERVPYNAMGAIVVSSVIGLIEFSEAKFLYRANFLDFLVWIAAFLGTVLLGVEVGLGIAIGLAIVLVVYQSAFPHTAILGALPDSKIYRNVKQYPMATQHAHILILRVDAPIYFANVEWIQNRLNKYHQRAEGELQLGRIHFVIIDMAPVPFVDSTGMHALRNICKSLKEQDVALVLANPSRKVQAQLQRVNLLSEIGFENVYVRTADAVDVCRAAVAERVKGEVAVVVAEESADVSDDYNHVDGATRVP